MSRWWERSKPDEMVARPWLHPEVTRFLEGLLHPTDRVLEHGSGGSTLWLAARVEQVFSIEADMAWFERIYAMRISNLTLMLWNQPTDPDCLAGTYDLMLIDGEPVERRAFYIEKASRLVKPGGWVVLDNANRPEYEEEHVRLRDQAEYSVTFNVNTPGMTRYLVTEFYKLRGGDHASWE